MNFGTFQDLREPCVKNNKTFWCLWFGVYKDGSVKSQRSAVVTLKLVYVAT